jgi:hypothetical protein
MPHIGRTTVHALEVAGVVVSFHQYACPDGWRLGAYRVEAEARDTYEWRERVAGRDGWRTDIVKPDLCLRFDSAVGTGTERSVDAFFEVDLGHTSADEWAKRLAVMRRYQETGAFSRRYDGRSGFVVLTLTTGETRRAHLLRLMAQEESPRVRFFAAGLAAFALTPNGPIWQAPNRATPLTFRDVLTEGAIP